MTDSLIPFKPHWLYSGGVLQTILGSQFPGTAILPDRKTHKISVGPKSTLIAFEIEGNDTNKPIILLAHGMGGCSDSGYMRRIAARLLKLQFGIFMLNHRGSGPGMGLSETLWNGGSSDDMDHIVQYILNLYPEKSLLIVGFSLSGNVLLKYLGEGRKIPDNVQGAFAVNPPIDLNIASQMLCTGKGAGIFTPHFMKLIRRQCRALAKGFPEAFQPTGKFKNIRDFDSVYTAPASGYKDVEEYYRKCSANQFLKSIKIPTQILCAKDDPFIPATIFAGLQKNGNINYLFPERGGHMGYLTSQSTPFGDSRWMDYVVAEWVKKASS